MTLEGAKVEAVFEVLPYSSGLQRNIRQCLDDYGIPLYLATTVIDIYGPNGRLEGVTVAEVDERRRPVKGTERFVPCDTLLLSVGLIPENELTREAEVLIDSVTQGADVDDSCMTKIPGIFACGNVLHVHDLVDFVSMEAARAGRNAALYAAGRLAGQNKEVAVKAGEGVRYVVPQRISRGEDVSLAFRVTTPSSGRVIEVRDGERVLKTKEETRLHPAEMVWVEMGKMDLEDISSLEVRVR